MNNIAPLSIKAVKKNCAMQNTCRRFPVENFELFKAGTPQTPNPPEVGGDIPHHWICPSPVTLFAPQSSRNVRNIG